MGRNLGKNISKNLDGKYNQKLYDHAKQFKRPKQELVIQLVIIFQIKLQKAQKINRRIFQRQLKVKQKYLKKDIYLQKKDIKLFMI